RLRPSARELIPEGNALQTGVGARPPRPQLAIGPRRPLTDGPNQVQGTVGDLADGHEFLSHRILELELALERRAGSGVRIDVNQRNDGADLSAARCAIGP